jgi:hypothetical protein
MSVPAIPGFSRVASQPKPRLILSIEGLDKSGKSRLAFTAPGPLGYLEFDIGAEGVIEQFQDEKVILAPKAYETRFDEGKQKTDATNEYARFERDYKNSIAGLRSTIIDTASETWELLRLARLGKLTQVLPVKYTEVNSEYRDLIRFAFENDSNLILLHKVKETWKNGADGKGTKTGEFERAGFSETGYLVQMNVRCWREEMTDEMRAAGDLGFRCQILNSRHNASIAGEILCNEQITFQTLAMMAMPTVDISNWE